MCHRRASQEVTNCGLLPGTMNDCTATHEEGNFVFNKSIDEDDEVLEIDNVKRVEMDTSATSSTTFGTGFESLIF